MRKYPFLFNNTRNNPEANTFAKIMEEVNILYGEDMYYIKRELLNEITEFGEFKTKVVSKAIPIRLFVEEVDLFAGTGNMYSKFGLTLGNQITAYGAKSIFKELNIVPKPQDILYYVMTDKLFEITHVTDENFPGVNYPLGKLYAYRIEATLFTFDITTDVQHVEVEQGIDNFEGVGVPPQLEEILNLHQKQIEQNNDKIEQDSEDIIDKSEKNPLLGD